MSVRTALCGVVAILLAAVLTAPASAQTLYGSVTGIVTDATGGTVPNAKVEVLNVGTGVLKTAQTDERGAYLFNDLQPGTYKVTFFPRRFPLAFSRAF